MVQMNERIKSLWVAKLRSGEYKQGNQRLKTGNNFCCLGVLCDIYLQEHGEQWDCGNDGVYSHFPLLPPKVKYWAELASTNPVVACSIGGKLEHRELSSANDLGAKFSDIADWIETQL